MTGWHGTATDRPQVAFSKTSLISKEYVGEWWKKKESHFGRQFSDKVVNRVEPVYSQIDAILSQMRSVVQAMCEQDPDFYAKHPMQLLAEADEQAIKSVTETWTLPEEYVYFLQHYVPQSVSWSTDDYINLDIYGAKDLPDGQLGYNYNPVTDEVIEDWPRSFLVIANDEGDPYCIDLSRGDTVIYTAEHGRGVWDFAVAYDNLAELLRSALRPRSITETDVEEMEDFIYNKVMITGAGADKLKTLLFIKKWFKCDYGQAKAHLEAAPLLVFKGLESVAAKVANELASIGAEYEVSQISFTEFVQR